MSNPTPKRSIPQKALSRQIYSDIIANASDKNYIKSLRTPYRMGWIKEWAIPSEQLFLRRQRQHLNTCYVEFQGDVVKVHCYKSGLAPPQGGERRMITKFSKKARKNMLEKVSRINWTGNRATFITLTYHEIEPSALVCKKHLRAFLKRLYRQYGDLAVLWRLEPLKRGAWHFHLIVWGLPYVERKELLKAWREITGQDTITQLDIKLIDDAKKARSYVAKYIGKEQGLAILDYMTNQAVGRFWGIENRANIAWAQLSCYSVQISQGFSEFKTAARGHWGKVGYGARVGFTLFVDNVQDWEQLLLELVNPWGIYDWDWGEHDGLL